MIDCAQVRVETLRQTLDDSLKQCPRRNSAPPPHPNSTSSSSSSTGILMKAAMTMTSEKRPLEVLYQSGSATCIQFAGANKTKISRFNISPTPNPLPAATIDNLQSGPRPLHIIVNDENSRLPTIDESAPMQTQQQQRLDAEAAVSTSPSDSIDSGVASPGDSPSTVSPVSNSESESCTVDDSAFSELKMRDRSVSEGVLAIKPTLLLPDGTPLKSILKKSKLELRSPSFNGGLKRSPAVPRLLFSRSMSECHDRTENEDDDTFSSILSNLGFNASDRSSPRMFNNVFDEDDELSLLEDAVGSQNSVDSENEPSPPGELQSRKKRVSFSDQVQARIYRSNSSILGQRKKNDKKKEKRLRRRSESESSDTPLNEEGDETITKSDNSNKCASLQDLFVPPKQHTDLERHDSGISDSIEADLEAKTFGISKPESKSSPVGSPNKPKLNKRVVSADSAIGFEEEEVGEASV